MANLNSAYDPNAEASKDFGAIPTGDYLFQIVDSDVKQEDGNTEIELVHEVVNGEYKGRKVWVYLKTVHANEMTMKIANSNFTSIREATGVLNPTDTQQLHYKPFIGRVEFIPSGTVKTSKTTGKSYTYTRDSNEIKSWKKDEGQARAQSSHNASISPSAPAANTQAASAAPPWAAKAA